MQLPYMIDVEASGFGRGSYPIEIGFARPDGQIEAKLLCPPDEWQHWSPEAEAVHGIARAQLLAEGVSIRDAAQWLNHALQGQTVYSDNWGLDSSWLALLFETAHMRQAFRVETLFRLLDEKQQASWLHNRLQMQQQLGLPRHRAAADVKVLQCTFEMTCNKTPV